MVDRKSVADLVEEEDVAVAIVAAVVAVVEEGGVTISCILGI